MTVHPSKPCVFFDRDGIVNRCPGRGKYVERLDDFHLQPQFFEALRVVNRKGYEAVVVTNQRGVARGRMTLETVEAIHAHLRQMVVREGLCLLDILYCPHGDDSHPHRKPNPGMILEAAARHGLDLKRSWMVGDSESDVLAGSRAGCKTILVSESRHDTIADFNLPGMEALALFLEQNL